MNGPFEKCRPQSIVAFPLEFEVLCPPPQLLPGESLDRYRALQAAIFQDIAPKSAIEWLLAIDIAEPSWEMQRYRRLRQRLLSINRRKAVEAMLRRIDLAGIAPEFEETAELYTVRNALDWQSDPIAAHSIEARLASHGFDDHAVSMEVYIQSREASSFFETLLNGAQLRRLLLLKELNNLRKRDFHFATSPQA
ncbi:hypothetical protein JQ621_24390 [Bradyrhizobium manausense]|uniref:hypothetical protein n=1 Tax=Bradyrhizobium manausense TaxID=989370 RepID=UPI001BAC6C31|nr:hypothetical protein [Bradyrhizobium manausense]MBR1090618.1 hypothetical protein [Bradyrhizobium manausense]